MRKLLLFLLSAYLIVWEPANLAAEFLGAFGTLRMRGVQGAVELFAHAVVAIVAVMAGWSVRVGAPHASGLAQAALAASAARTVQSLYWSALPHQTAPGQALPFAAAAVLHAAAWIAYLRVGRWRE